MNELSQLRNNIDFASISQFLHTFQSAFGPWTHQLDYPRSDQLDDRFETEDLEAMFLHVSSRPRLEDMIVRMLRTLTRNRFINQSSWQNYFAKEFDKREFDEENPLYTIETKEQQQQQQVEEDVEMNEQQQTAATATATTIEERVAVNYFTLPLDTKIHLIYLLCEWQLDEPEKLREHLETEDDCVQWRVDPIGFDKRGDIFWLFDDNRLYKESLTKPRPKKNPAPKKRHTAKGSRKSSRNAKQQEQKDDEEEEEEWKPWKLLCATSTEWEHIPEKFAQSTHIDEKRFHELLVNDVLPKVLPVIVEHEKELKKREAIIHRKRSSRIMIKELEALSTPEMPTAITSTSTGRASSRIEEKTAKKEEEEKERLQKAREERLFEREKRTMEREYRRLAREKKGEDGDGDDIDLQNGQSENSAPAIPPLKLIVKPSSSSDAKKKKRGRKPKSKSGDHEEESWEFECLCGVKGENLDDGSPMIACERCGVWQHIKCLRKYGQVHANKKTLDSITFVCRSCKIKNGEEVEPIRQVKRQKTNKQQKLQQQQQQQQHQGDQVTLPSIQIWERLQSPQITVISSQPPPLQPQPTRPILQALPQPLPLQSQAPHVIQPNHHHPILHPILEPRPTVPAHRQPPILEPQPSILEPSFQSHRPAPILPQPIFPPPQQQPVSKPSIFQSNNNIISSQPPLIRPPPSKPIIPEEPRPIPSVAATTALEAQPAPNVTPTLTDVTENNVTLENQEKSHIETVPSLPNNNNNS